MPFPLTFSFKGILAGFVRVKRIASLSDLNPLFEHSDLNPLFEHQGIEVKPPKMYPVVLLMTVKVFGFPSQSE